MLPVESHDVDDALISALLTGKPERLVVFSDVEADRWPISFELMRPTCLARTSALEAKLQYGQFRGG